MAAATIPVLEFEGEAVTLILRSGRSLGQTTDGMSEVASLPVGFRALRLRTARIKLLSFRHFGGAAMAGVAVHPAEELCRYFGLAPRCYREFRLFANGELRLKMELGQLPGRADGRDTYSCCGLQAMAAAIQQFAVGHGLVVSVSDDETHLLVTR